jgi:uncharacterized protein (TIGR03086 family)
MTSGSGVRLAPLVALDQSQTAAAAMIARLGPDDWARPTPCDEWTVRDVVNKMVASTIMFTTFARREQPDPPYDLVHPVELLGDDPLGVYLDVASASRAAWRRPGALDGTAPSTIGEFPATAVLNARVFDTTVLTWDVARASSTQHGITEALARYVLRVAKALVPTVRSVNPDRYKDPVHVGGEGDGGDVVDELVAVTGRDPRWAP